MAISEDIKPSFFSFNNTDRCQSRCITCPAWKTPWEVEKDELSTQQWKDSIKSIHDWVGDFKFIFSGGEPFLREDIFEIAQFAKDLGVTIDVVTNGLALGDKCEKLVDSAFSTIIFSLNSVKDPELHNVSRGRKDSFKKTMDVIQKVNYLNKKKGAQKGISLSSVVMPSNLDEIRPLAEFAKQEGIGVCYQLLDNGDAFSPPQGVNVEDGGFSAQITDKAIFAIDEMIELKSQGYPIYNGDSQLKAFKQLMLDMKEAAKNDSSQDVQCETIISENCQCDCVAQEDVTHIADLECQVGFHNFAINPYGEVRLCFCMDSIGSLKDDVPENIWSSDKAERIREAIKKCPKSCKLLNCNFKE